jgi:folate-binding protein YgfZ
VYVAIVGWKAGCIVQEMYVRRPLASLIMLTGRDRVQFLQGMVTNDVTSQYPSTGLRTFHLDNKGTIVYPMTIHITSEALYIDVEGAAASDVITLLDHYLVMERCALHDVLSTSESFWILGDVHDIFAAADKASDGNLHTFTIGDVQMYALPVIRRDGPCYVAWSPADLPSLFENAGLLHGTFEDAEHERLVAAIPAGCADFTRILAMESGIIGSAISFTKGCYIGQEITARIDARGRTHRELVLLEIPGDITSHEVRSDETVVGQIRSTHTGPMGESFAICHLRNDARLQPLFVGPLSVSTVRNIV